MSEIKITTEAGETLIATPENASLFRHIGESAMYDHVFIVDEEESHGYYVFPFSRSFETIADYMIENGFPLHLNQREAAECDRKAYDGAVDRMTREVDNWEIPADWS